RRLGKRKHGTVVFCAAAGRTYFSRIVVRQVGADYRIFFCTVGQTENVVPAQINHARFVPAHDHWGIPVEAITRLTFSRFGTQTAYLAILQIDPMDFALLTFRIKGVVISRIKQDVKSVATGKRGPIAVANTFLTLHSTRSRPVLVVLETARNSEIRFRVVERHSIIFS